MSNEPFIEPKNPENRSCDTCGRFRPDIARSGGGTCRICQVRDTEETDDSDSQVVPEDSDNCPKCGTFWNNEACGNCGYVVDPEDNE